MYTFCGISALVEEKGGARNARALDAAAQEPFVGGTESAPACSRALVEGSATLWRWCEGGDIIWHHALIRFRKLTPPENRHLNVLNSISKQ